MEDVWSPICLTASQENRAWTIGRSFPASCMFETGCRWTRRSASLGPPTTIYNRYQSLVPAPYLAAHFEKMAAAGPVLTSFPSTAAMSRRTARRLVQKGGSSRSDWPFARRKERSKDPCFRPMNRGRPVAFALTPGNVADITMGGSIAWMPSPDQKRLLADKA